MNSWLLLMFHKFFSYWTGITTIREPLGDDLKATDAEIKQAIGYGSGLFFMGNITQADDGDPDAEYVVPAPSQEKVGTDITIEHVRDDEAEYSVVISGLQEPDPDKFFVLLNNPALTLVSIIAEEVEEELTGNIIINYATAETDGYTTGIAVWYFG